MTCACCCGGTTLSTSRKRSWASEASERGATSCSCREVVPTTRCSCRSSRRRHLSWRPYAGKSRYTNHGQRVVRGQQYIQAASDIFLGWGREKWLDIYVRQLRDMKGSADVASMDPKRMALYGSLCGWALARAHARSGDAAKIAGYIGTSDRFDSALVELCQCVRRSDRARPRDACRGSQGRSDTGRDRSLSRGHALSCLVQSSDPGKIAP